MKKGMPKLRRLSLLEYFTGGSMGSLPRRRLLSLLDLHSSHRAWILENFLHAKFIATSLRGQSSKTISSFSSKPHIKNSFSYNISCCQKVLSKALAFKKLHFARERSNAKLRTESVKNRTDCKDKKFRVTSGPQIRKLKTRKRWTKP